VTSHYQSWSPAASKQFTEGKLLTNELLREALTPSYIANAAAAVSPSLQVVSLAGLKQEMLEDACDLCCVCSMKRAVGKLMSAARWRRRACRPPVELSAPHKYRPIHAPLAFTPSRTAAAAYISYNGAGVDNLIAIIQRRGSAGEGGGTVCQHRHHTMSPTPLTYV